MFCLAQVSFCDPESPAKYTSEGIRSALFGVSGASAFAAPNVVRFMLGRDAQQAAAAAVEGPEQDVYGLYRCLLRLLVICHGADFRVRVVPATCVLLCCLLASKLLYAMNTADMQKSSSEVLQSPAAGTFIVRTRSDAQSSCFVL